MVYATRSILGSIASTSRVDLRRGDVSPPALETADRHHKRVLFEQLVQRGPLHRPRHFQQLLRDKAVRNARQFAALLCGAIDKLCGQRDDRPERWHRHLLGLAIPHLTSGLTGRASHHW